MVHAVIEGFELSPQQRRIWRLQQREEGSFRAQAAFRLEGALDRDVLRRSLREVVARHEILRTTYRRLPGMDLPIQVIGEEPRFSYRELAAGDGDEEDVLEFLDQEAVASSDCDESPPPRFALLPVGEREQLMTVTLPPASADDRSLCNLLAEIAGRYGCAVEGSRPPDARGYQYADFSEWQNGVLEEDEAGARREFWRRSGRTSGLHLGRPPAAGEVAARGDGRRSHRRWLDPGLACELEAFAVRQGVSVATVLLAAWRLLLWRLLPESDVVVGWLADGRRFEQLEGVLGLIARYLPIRISPQPDLTFSELVAAAHDTGEEAARHQEYFLWEDYVGDGAEGSAGATRFPALFDFADTPAPREAAGVRFTLIERRVSLEAGDLRLSVLRRAGTLRLELSWRAAGHFGADEAERWLTRCAAMLRSAMRCTERPVAELDLLDEQEEAALAAWSRGAAPAACESPAHLLFERQAERTPDAAAVVWDGGAMTYAALDRRANQLARYLSRSGLATGGCLVLALERSAEQIVGLLAAWKAGAAFVPLDPAQPPRRLARMLEDLAGAAAGRLFVLTRRALRGRVAPPGAPVVEIDAEAEAIGRESPLPLGQRGDADLPAYALFTSGSTGWPKATIIRHRSVLNLGAALERAVYAAHGGGPLRVGANAPLTFDASIKQAVQLLGGQTLHLIPEEVRRDCEAFVALLREWALDVLDCTPSQLRLLLGAGLLSGARPRLVLVGGEALDRALWETLAGDPEAAYYNVYGPTECTVDSTVERIAAGAPPNIGRPLPGVDVLLLDPALRRVPVGVPGEICIGGGGVGLGYAGRPDQTADSFVPHPFAAAPGERLYRSGDLARHLPDGRIEFLGRRDHQVKLRGFRVELGEVEAAIAEHPGVREAVVLAREDQAATRLVAYIVPRSGAAARPEARDRHRLPNGLSVYLLDRTETDYMFQEIFEDGCYLRHGLELPENAVVFDVGANIGLFTLFIGQQAPRARVYAFEPIAPIFEILRANTACSGIDVRLFAYGLADREERAGFTFYPRFSSRSGLTAYADRDNEVAVTRRHMANTWGAVPGGGEPGLLVEMDGILDAKFFAETIEAPLRRLADVIREEGVERVDLLKIDVQRAELAVLQGMDDEAWERVAQVAMEVHDEPGGPTEGRLAEIAALLARRGFQVLAEQDAALRGTDRHMLFASRRGLRAGAAAPALAAPAAAGELSGLLLRRFLDERLPEHMLPAEFVFLDELPYNRSGKVDRLALPAPEQVQKDRERPVLAPRTPVEEVLSSLFADVLGLRRLGVDESFFDLGGHSLLATQLASRVREAFQIELPLRTLFEAPTVERLARHVESALQAGRAAVPRIEPVPRGADLPLSYAQESLWFLHQMNPQGAAYNSARAMHILGRLDPQVVEAVLSEVVRRHEVLRTTFPAPRGTPVQRIAPPAPMRLSPVDLGRLPAPERAAEARRCAREAVLRPFDLAVEPPLRVELLQLGAEDHVLVLTLHHIACDGWSLFVLQREVAALYAAFAERRPSPLAEPVLQYADFACWQRQWIRGPVLEEHLAYWKTQLAGAPPVLELPRDGAPAEPEPGAATRSFPLPGELVAGLRDLGRRHGATLYMTLLAAFGVLLARTAGQEDLVVGTAVAGRDRAETERLIGLFINMLPIRLDLAGAPRFLDLLARVREVTIGGYVHQGLPFEKLAEELPRARSSARNPIFQVAFGVQNLPAEPFAVRGLTITPWQIGPEEARLELTLWIAEGPDGVSAVWTYDRALFGALTIERWQARFARLLHSILVSPEAGILDLELLTKEERLEQESRRRLRESANLSRLRAVQRRSVERV